MRRYARFLVWVTLSTLLLGAAMAQDDEEETAPAVQGGFGDIQVEVEAWVAQPTGVEYSPGARLDETNPFGTTILEMPQGTRNRFRWTVSYEFNNNVGEIRLTYYSHDVESMLSLRNPGNFVYAETQPVAFQTGVFGDGLADGLDGFSRTRLRDHRIDFSRRAFSGNRVKTRWLLGYRRIDHERTFNTTYFGLAPSIPALIPPVVDPARFDLMLALPDSARVASDYEGRGAEAGLELQFPLKGDRLWVEGSLMLAVLRGKMSTRFNSVTHVYALVDDAEVLGFLLPEEFDLLDDPIDPSDPGSDPLADFVQQIRTPAGLNSSRESATAQVLETSLGLRWRAWKGLEVSAGFRNIRYDDVGLDLRPSSVEIEKDLTLDEFGADGVPLLRLNVGDVERVKRSVDYEGFYVGVAYRY